MRTNRGKNRQAGVSAALLSLLAAIPLASPGPLAASVYGPAPYYENLLVNPNGDSGDLQGWTVTTNGGDGWLAHHGIYPDETADNGFLTSYNWSRREQVVDLLSRGFTADFLDSQPTILVSEIFEKVFCPDYFFVQVELLDANRNLIRSWGSNDTRHSDPTCDYSGYKEKISHEIKNYGTGVRYIRWRDGGKDSEYWLGHFGPKLQNAYLALAPANLLKNPGELSSWTTNGPLAFELTGPPDDRQFRTSYFWGQRKQIVDLLALGFTAGELDSGELPIIAEGTYKEVACPDQYYLKVALLDQNQVVLASQDSGLLTHGGECDWTYSEYGETIHHRFVNYPPGVRYILWEDGGKDREYWAGRFGAILQSPYLRIIRRPSYGPAATVAPDYAVANHGSDDSALYAALPARLLSEVPPHSTDAQVTACDAGCKMEQIRQGLDTGGYPGSLWRVDRNSAVQIFASPVEGDSDNETLDLATPGQKLRQTVGDMVARGTKLIDITTLDYINDEWLDTLANALQQVETRAASSLTYSPVVRVHLGISHDAKAEADWDGHFDYTLRRLTAKLAGNTNLRVFISGSETGSVFNLHWNHAKIVAVDGKEAVVGGHNLWSVYLNPAPVFDTSVKITGDSAVAAHRFVDQLWMDHNTQFPVNTHVLVWNRNSVLPGKFATDSFAAIGQPSTTGGPIQVLGVGQTSKDHGSPLQKAVLNMMNAAENSIYLSQQMLTHFEINAAYSPVLVKVDEALAASLVRKAIAGVAVHVILSNPEAPHGTNANTRNEQLLKYMWQAGGVPDTLENRSRFCQHVKAAYLRIDGSSKTYEEFNAATGLDMGFANHSKTAMIDKQVLMVGSNNLYPVTPAQLSEYAYIIANADVAEQFYRSYWKRVWGYSEETAVSEETCMTMIAPLPAVFAVWTPT